LVAAGKYRNGAARSWCRTHQQYWGIKADLAALQHSGVQRCAGFALPMGYVIQPLVLDMRQHASITINYHQHGMRITAVPGAAGEPALNTDVTAFALACDASAPLFGDPQIMHVNITPPAVQALGAARGSAMAMGCVNCSRCGHPHLDLGTFATSEHRRHYCGNCGHDATHSKRPMISNPLLALLDAYDGRLQIVDSSVHVDTVL
jgi:hypothetical protein